MPDLGRLALPGALGHALCRFLTYKGLTMKDSQDYFCLASDGLIYALGNHGDIEAADDTARSIALEAIWIFDQETAHDWAATLKKHGVQA